MKRRFQILLAEPGERGRLRRLIRGRRLVRHARNQQECLDYAFAASADVVLLDGDSEPFGSPQFVSRLRFVSRNAFPILVARSNPSENSKDWLEAGAAELIDPSCLDALLLDRLLRHWAKHYRLRRRLFDADRRANQWWHDLVEALDEVRQRIEREHDSIEAFVNLLDQGGSPTEERERYLDQIRKHLASLLGLTSELETASKTIRRKGARRALAAAAEGKRTPPLWSPPPPAEEGDRSIDHPHLGKQQSRKRYGA